MNSALKKVLKEIEVDNRNSDSYSNDSKRSSHVSPEFGEFLWMLVKTTNTQSILEVGTSTGSSTLWMADALPNSGKVITLDHLSENNLSESEFLSKLESIPKLKNKIEKTKVDVKDYFKNNRREYDFVFLNADPLEYIYYIEGLAAAIKPKGLLVCHNARLRQKELNTFTDFFRTREDFNSSIIEVGPGAFIAHKTHWVFPA